MEHVKPIVDDPDQARKRLLLKRDLPLKAVGTRSSHYLFVTARAESEALQPPALQQILKSEPSARLVVHSLPISVDNISYGQFLTVFRNLTRSEDILRSLLPDDIEIPTSYEIVGRAPLALTRY